jgi:hypothetical protein
MFAYVFDWPDTNSNILNISHTRDVIPLLFDRIYPITRVFKTTED